MIIVKDLFFSFGEKPLFCGVDFIVGKGQKVGLVGPNGSGKTTLFRLLSRKEMPDGGTVETVGEVVLVPQEIKYDQEMEESRSIRKYLDKNDEHKDFELLRLLHSLDLDDLDLKSSAWRLSGGQKTKMALAKALLDEPDILLLDEPTNFMDFKGKRWVMNFLSKYPKTLVLVSHDLKLLDEAIDRVLYINPQTHKIEEYKGNYSKFINLKEEKEALLKRQITAEQKHIKRLEESLKILYRYTSKKGVRARVMLQRRIARLKESLPDLPLEVRRIKVKLPTPLPTGELPIRAASISKSFGKNEVFKNINFSVMKGERVALIGPNGVGKSTLIKILVGVLKSDRGKVTKNDNLKIGYYSQEFETLDPEKTLLQTIRNGCHQAEAFARPFLGRFNFLKTKVFQKVKYLSGGEKTRLAIALLAGQDFNLLVLDEPTTYLDPLSQRIILNTLKEYRGTMIIVSHTREFISELKPNRAFLMPENKMVFWSDELLEKVAEV
ncbi:MAG TPA: ABC-F family ATP-binding cassette domain-containing protein [Candidatus Bathyarchaeia archaeon]|nr:ABC-F family ATP-binding cassette domain-containing protein [Candidatus Bathyarchaeia archaeon]